MGEPSGNMDAMGTKSVFRQLQDELYVGRLLHGEYNSEQEAQQAPEGCAFLLTGSHFMVLNLVIDNITSDWLSASIDSFANLRNTIIPQVEKAFFRFLEGLFDNYYCVIDHAMSIVICLQPEDIQAGQTSIISQIIQKTQERVQELEHNGIYVSAFLSGICQGMLGIETAYKQIYELRDYKKIMGITARLLQYDRLDRPLELTAGMPQVEQRELDCYLAYFQAVRIKDYTLALQSFLDLLDEVFYRFPPPPHAIDKEYKTFIHMMFLSVNEIRKSADAYIEEMMRPEKLLRSEFSIQQIQENFVQLFNLLKDYHSGVEKPRIPSWYQSMLRYIENNFSDVSLNVSSLAEQFSLKPAYLSRAFKQYSGMRLLDYINIMRVRFAKKQILSGATVSQTATEAGFGSVLTMRRAFLKFEGTLPSKI